MERSVFTCCFPFPNVSTKNIYYCGQKPGETVIAHMISDYVSHALNIKFRNLKIIQFVFYFFVLGLQETFGRFVTTNFKSIENCYTFPQTSGNSSMPHDIQNCTSWIRECLGQWRKTRRRFCCEFQQSNRPRHLQRFY